MNTQQIIFGLVSFFHNLFTIVWVGGLVLILITFIPSARSVYSKGPQLELLMNAILDRQRVWVYISIVGLAVTGVIQARTQPGFNGLMRFDSMYGVLISLKHIATLFMIAIALFRSFVFRKKSKNGSPLQMRRGLQLIAINASLGMIVLLLSGFLVAL